MSDMRDLIKLYRSRVADRRKAKTRRRRNVEATPQPMGNLLTAFFRGNPTALRGIQESRALRAWPEFVGEAAARVSKARKIRSGKLIVSVADPVFMQQLFLLKNSLVKRYQSEYPEVGIRDIFFVHQWN